MVRIATLIALSALSSTAAADCYCTCVGGQNRPICTNATELPPLCPPKVCPIEPPSVPPIFGPRIPPIGTKVCGPQMVWDANYGRYVWKQVCR